MKPRIGKQRVFCFRVIKDEDRGPCSGAWALDTLDVRLVITHLGNNTWRYRADVTGRWKTFKGARSPQACIIQPCRGSGSVTGFLAGEVKDAHPPCRTKCCVYHLGGTKRNILLPLDQQLPKPTLLSTIQTILCASSISLLDFSADYSYRGQVVWRNRPSGNTGDVIISKK